MKTKNSNISKLSFICAIMVIALHSYGMADLVGGNLVISYISHGLTTVAVPTFFFLSGYLLFKHVDKIEVLFAKLKRRLKSLVLPYICWNILYFVFYIVSGNSSLRVGSVEMDYSVLGMIEAIFFHKYCFNLWFLLNLIVFTFVLSVPTFYLLKTKAIWILWVAMLCSTFVMDLEINIVLTGDKISLFSVAYFVYWLLGVIWSKKEMLCGDYKLCLAGYLLISIGVMYVKDIGAFSRLECLLVLINMICFLMSAKTWLSHMKEPKYNMNMILYGGAGFVQIIYTKAISILLSIVELPMIAVILLYFFEILLTVVICYYIGVFMKKYAKPIYVAFAGNR